MLSVIGSILILTNEGINMKKFNIEIKSAEHGKVLRRALIDLGYKMYSNETILIPQHKFAGFDGTHILGSPQIYAASSRILITLDDLFEMHAEKCKYSMTNEEKRPEFEKLVKPVIEFLNDYYIPHTKIIIETDGAEITTGEMSFRTTEFIKD